nr:uncharacterized protein LOC125184232 [Anser cygnoides]
MGYFKSPLVLKHRGVSYSCPSRLDSSNGLGYSAILPSVVSLFFIKLLIGLKGGKRALHGKPPQVTSTVITYGQRFSSHGDSRLLGQHRCRVKACSSSFMPDWPDSSGHCQKKQVPVLLARQDGSSQQDVLLLGTSESSKSKRAEARGRRVWMRCARAPCNLCNPAASGGAFQDGSSGENGLSESCWSLLATSVKSVCVHLLECNQQKFGWSQIPDIQTWQFLTHVT